MKHKIILAATLAFAVAAPVCAQDENAPLKNASSVDQFIAALPNWKAVNPPVAKKDDASAPVKSKETQDGHSFTATTVKHDVSDTPTDIVTYQPVNGFWLGAIVQGRGLSSLGTLEEVPVPAEKRAPFKVSSDLGMADTSRDITMPSVSEVNSAIGDIMQAANGKQTGNSFTLNVVDNYDAKQTALDLGLNVNYLSNSLESALKVDHNAENHTVTVAFYQKAFTVTADFGGRSRRPAFFNGAFALDDAKSLVDQDKIGVHNLPAYVKSITYGRVVLINVTSNLSEDELKAAIKGSVQAGQVNVGASFASDNKYKQAHYSVTATQIGGTQGAFKTLSPKDGLQGFSNVLAVMNDYLQEDAPVSTMVPISYTLNTLRDDQLAAMPVTTSYTTVQYAPDAIGEKFKLHVSVHVNDSEDGPFDNTLEVYGTLKVNGETYWDASRSRADDFQFEKGQDIPLDEDKRGNLVKQGMWEVTQNFDNGTPLTVEMSLTDKDTASADDPIGLVKQTLTYKQLHDAAKSGKPISFPWSSGQGESTTLNISVTSEGQVQ